MYPDVASGTGILRNRIGVRLVQVWVASDRVWNVQDHEDDKGRDGDPSRKAEGLLDVFGRVLVDGHGRFKVEVQAGTAQRRSSRPSAERSCDHLRLLLLGSFQLVQCRRVDGDLLDRVRVVCVEGASLDPVVILGPDERAKQSNEAAQAEAGSEPRLCVRNTGARPSTQKSETYLRTLPISMG